MSYFVLDEKQFDKGSNENLEKTCLHEMPSSTDVDDQSNLKRNNLYDLLGCLRTLMVQGR